MTAPMTAPGPRRSPSPRLDRPGPDPNQNPRRHRVLTAAAIGALATWTAFGADTGLGLPSRLLTGMAVMAFLTLGLPRLAAAWIPDLLARTFYRVRVHGASNLPRHGGALLVANHVSFVDALLMLAASPRPIRFLVDERYARHWFCRPFLRAAGAIPISAGGSRRERTLALRAATDTLAEGGLVGIFAEGAITRNGALQPFRRGLELLARHAKVPIVPVHLALLSGAWWTWRSGGRLSRFPRRIAEPAGVAFGRRLEAQAPAPEVRQAVQELGPEAWRLVQPDEPVHARFVTRARFHPRSLAFADSTGRELRSAPALAAALSLGRRVSQRCPDESRLGVLLPPSVGGALTQLALSLGGRTSVPLNYTTGADAMASALEQAEVRTVLTSRAFLDRVDLTLPSSVRLLCLEELLGDVTLLEKVCALCLGLLTPRRWMERYAGAKRPVAAEEVATILFSSGSSGEPKGIVLAHRQLAANVIGTGQTVPLAAGQKLLGVLPFFHAFGTLALWFAASRGAVTVFHPNPLDVKTLGRLIRERRIEVLVAPPTFLGRYLDRWSAQDVRSLRLVIAGAEALPPRLAVAYRERFGIELREGYGATECSPVIAVNVPDVPTPHGVQPGTRIGTVGRPLANLAVRIRSRDHQRQLGHGEVGRIEVRGDSVMSGYLGRPEATARVLSEGWYDTGDLGSIDEDGFLTIVDRASRFSKIGGEMVPHGRVEQALQEATGHPERCIAVTSVPDVRRGERLAVLHTLDAEEVTRLLEVMPTMLPPLFRPHPSYLVAVDELPLLGSGKLDLVALRRLALEHLPVPDRCDAT